METREIIALLESLCEQPFAGEGADPSDRLQALRREALGLLSRAGQGETRETVVETERLTALLATLISGEGDAPAREKFAEAMARSATLRLDAESALAYVDAIERSGDAAPAHLLDELVAGEEQSGAGPWRSPPPVRTTWLVRRWRPASAFAVVLVAVGATLSLYQPSNDGGSAPPSPQALKILRAPAPVADAPMVSHPAASSPAVAAAPPPCEPAPAGTATTATQDAAAAAQAPAAAPPAPDCPAPGSRLADRPDDKATAATARAQAEAARAQAAAAAAAKVGGSMQADHAAPSIGTDRPAAASATRVAPAAAAPSARPAASPTMR